LAPETSVKRTPIPEDMLLGLDSGWFDQATSAGSSKGRRLGAIIKILSFSLGLSGRSQLMKAPSLLISLVSATMTPLSAMITTGHFTLTLVGVRRSAAIVVSR
jgi:hypothetical protein